MARPSKSFRSKPSTAAATPSKGAGKITATDVPTDPLRAFPADPPSKNYALLIVSVVLFAVWFCYLAYIALRG